MPIRNITYSIATTRGRVSSVARSAASASPAVWVMCSPSPVIRKASAASASPAQAGPTVWSPDSTISAKGMIASPPICHKEPNHR